MLALCDVENELYRVFSFTNIGSNFSIQDVSSGWNKIFYMVSTYNFGIKFFRPGAKGAEVVSNII